MFFDFQIIIRNLPLLLNGALTTIWIATLSFVIGAFLGMVLHYLRTIDLHSLKLLANGFIRVFRTIPEIVPLMWLYACAPFILNVNISAEATSVIAFSLVTAASFAEIYRLGLEAVPEGQRDAARSLGMSRFLTLRKVVMPQLVRLIVPPAINLYSDTVKISSLVSMIGITDLIYEATIISAQSFRYIELYTFAGVVYFTIIVSMSLLADATSRRLTRYMDIKR